MAETQETQMSIKAKDILEELVKSGQIHENSPHGRVIKGLSYNPEKREELFDQGTDFNITKAYGLIGLEEQQFYLLKQAVECNLTEQQVGEVVKHRFRDNYGIESFGDNLGNLETARKQYPSWCKQVSIKPDISFPDWQV